MSDSSGAGVRGADVLVTSAEDDELVPWHLRSRRPFSDARAADEDLRALEPVLAHARSRFSATLLGLSGAERLRRSLAALLLASGERTPPRVVVSLDVEDEWSADTLFGLYRHLLYSKEDVLFATRVVLLPLSPLLVVEPVDLVRQPAWASTVAVRLGHSAGPTEEDPEQRFSVPEFTFFRCVESSLLREWGGALFDAATIPAPSALPVDAHTLFPTLAPGAAVVRSFALRERATFFPLGAEAVVRGLAGGGQASSAQFSSAPPSPARRRSVCVDLLPFSTAFRARGGVARVWREVLPELVGRLAPGSAVVLVERTRCRGDGRPLTPWAWATFPVAGFLEMARQAEVVVTQRVVCDFHLTHTDVGDAGRSGPLRSFWPTVSGPHPAWAEIEADQASMQSACASGMEELEALLQRRRQLRRPSPPRAPATSSDAPPTEPAASVRPPVFLSGEAAVLPRGPRWKSVLVVHDMIPEKFQWDLGRNLWLLPKHDALRRAHALVGVSPTTAADIAAQWSSVFGSLPAPVQPPTLTSRNGVGAAFYRMSCDEVRATLRPLRLHVSLNAPGEECGMAHETARGPLTDPSVRGSAADFVLDRPWFLLVGNRKGYKAIQQALGVLAHAPHLRGRLGFVFVGPPMETDDLERLATLEAQWVRLEGRGITASSTHPVAERTWHAGEVVPDRVLAALYSSAWGLLYPSQAEGFGLPIAEAGMCGCPAIHWDTDVSRFAALGVGLPMHDAESLVRQVAFLAGILHDEPSEGVLAALRDTVQDVFRARQPSWAALAASVETAMEAAGGCGGRSAGC